MRLYRTLIYFISIVLMVVSCKTIRPTEMFKTPRNYSFDTNQNKSKATILQPYDQITILMATNNGTNLLENNGAVGGQTLSENNNLLTYLILEDSTVKIPTLGYIKIGGLPKDSAEVVLEKALGNFYQNPFIRISITNRHVILFSENATKGQIIPIPEEGMSLIDAIAKSGGLSENSKAYRIKLIRGDNNNPQVFTYNLRNFEKFKSANLTLQSKDIIYIESRTRHINTIINEMQPYVTLLTTLVLTYSIFTR